MRVAALAATLLLVAAAVLASHAERLNATVVLYGVHTCPHCRATWAAITRLKEAGVVSSATFLDLGVKANAKAYAEMFKLWMLRACSETRVLCTTPGVPLTYVEAGGHAALILGELAPGNETLNWLRVIEDLSKGVAVNGLNETVHFKSLVCISMPYCSRVLSRVTGLLEKRGEARIAARLVCIGGHALCATFNETMEPILPSAGAAARRATSNGGGPGAERLGLDALVGLLPVLVGLAALDAVNPCFLALYALTIAAVAGLRGRLAAVKTGLGVALGVFTGYYLLGLGLVEALAAMPLVRYALAAAVIALGVFTVAKEYGLVRLSEECAACRLASKLGIGSARMTPLLGYAFGLVASLTLLPCSAGPYAVAAVYLSKLEPLARLAGLLVYNLVFIAPIVAMAFAASFAAAYAAVERVLRKAAGPILVVLGLLIIAGLV